MKNKVKDFFISYTQQDKQWAEWIAGTLEKAGNSVIIQDWDFKPGENFVLNMDKALKLGKRFIAVMSQAYFNSPYCQAEWSAAFTKDPNMEMSLFIPVRIEDMKIEVLLAPVVYIDFVGKSEGDAEKELLEGISTVERPRNRPSFPGTKRVKFPGALPFNNLPANRNPHFTGREDKLDEIHQTFEKKEAVALTQAISGLGGIGKTQIALEYAFRYGYEYDCIWWANAETDNTILASFQDFAKKKKIVNEDTKETEVIIEAVRYWMQQNDNWLFIYDNAEEEKSLQSVLPAQNLKKQHVLITSRNTRFLKCTPVNIGIFTEAEACAFIEKYTQKPPDKHFKVLAKKMGYLPLALDQAGAYMAASKKSYEDYSDLYDRKNLALLTKYRDDPDKKTVATTWQVSIEKIDNTAAKQLLNLCAFFAPENIYLDFLTNASEVLPDELRKAADDEIDFDDAIAELTKYSLVSLNESALSIHRLVQEVVRDSLKQKQTHYRNLYISILNKLTFSDFSTVALRERFRTLVPHILSVTNKISKEDETEELSELYHFLGWGFEDLADYDRALEYCEKVIAIRENILGKEHLKTAKAYNNIAVVYYSLSKYDLALEYYEKDLLISKKVLGKEHPDTASSYYNMGMVFDDKSEYDLALDYYRKALAIREKVLGKEHPDVANCYHNISLVYDAQDNNVLAWEYATKALTICEKTFGEEHIEMTSSYSNIGGLYYSQCKYDLALTYYEKDLAISEKILGNKHPNTARTYYNIGLVYSQKEDLEHALEYFNKALANQEKVLGIAHPSTADTYDGIGDVYRSQGDYQRALEYYGKALDIKKKRVGDEHPSTAYPYDGIGDVYLAQGDYERALEYHRKALVIREKVLGAGHSNTATSYNNMASVYYARGDNNRALEYYGKALAIREKALGDEHPYTKKTYDKMAICYEKTDNSEPFDEWLEQRGDFNHGDGRQKRHCR